MKLHRLAPICFVLILLAQRPALGQEGDVAAPPPTVDPVASAEQAPDMRDIVVIGERQKQEEAVRGLTAEITRRPRTDKPLSRFYKPLCLKIIGLKPDYADLVAKRIEDNWSELEVPVAGRECTPNALLIFTEDGRKAVETLREDEAWLFANLLDYEYERIIAGDAAAYAWQTTELRGVDGKPFRVAVMDMCGNKPCEIRREVTVNDKYQTGRLSQPIRVDMKGAVVLIDNAYLPGKTLDQLADYATMRLLSATDEAPADRADAVPTILSLFIAPESAPPGLTRFDRSYLRALYSLRPNANALSIRDATLSAYFASEPEE